MSRRQLGSIASLVMLLAAFGAPATASATKTVGFRLSNTTAAAVSEMYFDLVPHGTILPRVLDIDPDGAVVHGSPMTALPSSTGIDVSTSYVLLTDDPADPDLERMFLLFGHDPDPGVPAGGVPFRPLVDGDGNRVGKLAPGGTFDFELNLAQEAIAWLLKPGIDGLTLSILDLPSPGPDPMPGHPADPGAPSGTPIPEPSALLLWAAVGLGVLALSRRRRAVPTPS